MSDDADVRDCVWICDTCGTSSWKKWGCRCEVQALYMSPGGLDRDVTVSHAGDVIWSTEGRRVRGTRGLGVGDLQRMCQFVNYHS